MAQSSKSGKKRITQQELRRLMNEQKSKFVQATKKIDSPLAKYTNSGQLMCILCSCEVQNAAEWPVHIISKQHKNYRSRSRQLQDSTAMHTQTNADMLAEFANLELPGKRKAGFDQPSSVKKLKSIIKTTIHSDEETSNDITVPTVAVNTDISQLTSSLPSMIPLPKQVDLSDPTVTLATSVSDVKKASRNIVDVLPKGFFDDPEMDAKARKIEYKNPVEIEWAKFQKEIKEETDLSAQIIAEDQDIATAERQINEIDEQMKNWERVIELEQRLEEVKKQEKKEKERPLSPDDIEFDEFPDWRRKKAYSQ